MPEPGDLTLEIGSRPGVVDDHVGGGEPMVAGGLRGDPGMATAGSGDVLTGIILGLLARGYKPEHACLIAVYVHGHAADLYVKKFSDESMLASDLIELLPVAFNL